MAFAVGDLVMVLCAIAWKFPMTSAQMNNDFQQQFPGGPGAQGGNFGSKPSSSQAWIMGIAMSLALSLAGIVTLLLIALCRRNKDTKSSLTFVGMGAGAMLSTALLVLLPESQEVLEIPAAGELLLAGILFGMVLEVAIHSIAGHHDEDSDSEESEEEDNGEQGEWSEIDREYEERDRKWRDQKLSKSKKAMKHNFAPDAAKNGFRETNEPSTFAKPNSGFERRTTKQTRNLPPLLNQETLARIGVKNSAVKKNEISANANLMNESKQFKSDTISAHSSIDFQSAISLSSEEQQQERKIREKNRALAWNNVVGSCIHNFLDGILLGVIFLNSTKSGLLVTFSTVFHEVPREVGDFFILLHSGYTTKRAVLLNIVGGVFALIGTVIGLAVGSTLGDNVGMFLPVVGGMFLYTALVQLLPEFLELKNKISRRKAFLAFTFGLFLMGLLANFDFGEEDNGEGTVVQ